MRWGREEANKRCAMKPATVVDGWWTLWEPVREEVAPELIPTKEGAGHLYQFITPHELKAALGGVNSLICTNCTWPSKVVFGGQKTSSGSWKLAMCPEGGGWGDING